MAASGIKWVDYDYDYKVKLPSEAKAENEGNNDSQSKLSRNAEALAGIKYVSGSATLLKTEPVVLNEEWNLKVGANGPSVGGSAGLDRNTEVGAGAMFEASAMKAEGQMGNLYASVGLNADTGVKVNNEGFKVGVFGFGVNMGIGGKFTLNTPMGSIGSAPAQTISDKTSENGLCPAS